MKYFFLMLVMVVASCSSKKGTNAKQVQEQTETVMEQDELTFLVRDNYGGSEEPEIQIIKDVKSLEKFFSKVNITRKPGLPIPEIDFEKEMVILVCSGGATGNGTPAVYKISEAEDEMVLEVIQENTLTSAENTAYLTPFCLYKMPLSEKVITFKHK